MACLCGASGFFASGWKSRSLLPSRPQRASQPKRHLLTSGWSVFVSTKRLFAGDSVLVIRDEKTQLLLGIKRANRQQPALSSSVISSDSMHIGILAAAAHAAANNSPFTIFYNPRASPSEFVIPLSKYNKAMYTQVSIGMRFRMMFETEESSIRRYMGTITGISDLDPVGWKNSQWRNLQVGWDESAAGERPSRVSIWETEPVVTPFYIYPPPFFRSPDDEYDIENAYKRTMPWLGNDFVMKDTPSSIFPGMSLVQWMNKQQNNQFSAVQSGFFPSIVSSTAPHNNLNADDPSKLLGFQPPTMSAPSLQFNKANAQNQVSQFQQPPITWPQQQHLQQLMQNPINQQQLQIQQELQQLPQRQQLQQQQPQQQQQQPQLEQQQHQHQQICHLGVVNNAVVAPKQVSNQSSQQPVEYSQLQPQQMLMGNTQTQQSIHSNNKSSLQLTSIPQDSQFLQQTELQACLLQRQQQQHAQLQQSSIQLFQLQQSQSQRGHQLPQLQQLSQIGLSDQQLQLQLLQKLQHQQQLLSPANPLLQPQLPQQQQPNLLNQQVPLLPSSQHQPQQLSSNSFSTEKHINGNSLSTSALMQSQQIPLNHAQIQHKPLPTVRAHSGLTEGDAPSCSTSPSSNNCQVSPSNLLSRNHQGPTLLVSDSLVEPANNIQELHCKSALQIKEELSSSKGPDQVKYRSTITDQLEASSSGTSYCLDAGTIQPNFPIPTFGLDGDVQSNPRNNHPLAANIDGLAPDTFLFRGYDSQKDLQNLLSSYGGTPSDIETDLPTTAISSQSFRVPNIPFKPGCSNDIAINEAGAFGSGVWANQTQRMRTYTKVQKRGSVGRCIDVNRYKGYDDLRHDLALMFGIEGQLQDPQRNEWKLVYVDHENDILLVGDDPWEEFVSCVQSIKILSSAEVEQMSLDGDLGHIPGVQNQACRL